MSKPQSAIRNEEVWSALGALLLVGVLVGAIVAAWDGRGGVGAYNLGRAEALLFEGRYTEATQMLERTVAFYPTMGSRLLLSEAYGARRDYARAATQARAALQVAPPYGEAYVWAQLGRVLAANDKGEEAIGAWQRAIETGKRYQTDPGVARQARSATWQIARHHWQAGKYEAALPHLESLRSESDIYGQVARLRLAQFYAPIDFQLSQERLGSVGFGDDQGTSFRVSRYEGLPSDEEMRQVALLLLEGHGEAGKALASGADTGVLLVLWGTSYLQQGEIQLAVRTLEEAIKLRPGSGDIHTRLGVAFLALGDIDAAVPHFQAAIRISPRDPFTRRILAGLYSNRKEWALAEAEFAAWREIEPVSVELHLGMAEHYRLKGDYEIAENEFLKAVDLQQTGTGDSNTPNASLALARFYIDVRGQTCQKALPHAQAALARSPRDPSALDALGWALSACDQAEAGVAPLEAAVEVSPGEPRYRYHLGRAYATLNRRDDARTQLTRILDLDPNGPWSNLATEELARLERQ